MNDAAQRESPTDAPESDGAARELSSKSAEGQGNPEIVSTFPSGRRLRDRKQVTALMDLSAVSPVFAAQVCSDAMADVIDACLRKKGVRDADVEDQRQEVMLKLLKMKEPPAGDGEREALARKFSGDQAIDYLRKKARLARRIGGPTDQADEHPHNDTGVPAAERAMEAKERAEVCRQLVAHGELEGVDARILLLDAKGESHADIARTTKLAVQTVRNKLGRARKLLGAAWTKRNEIAAAVLLLAFLFLVLPRLAKDPHVQALWHRGEISPDDTHAPPAPSVPPSPPPQELADGLRTKAAKECADFELDACEADLDAARALDPAGEDLPKVRQMRERLQATPVHDPKESK